MRSYRLTATLVAALLALVSCSRDPNVAKKHYLDNGTKYFERGNYKAAAIMYRNAIQKDQKYGPAHYHLALTYLKTSNLAGAVHELRVSIELLKSASSPEYWDSVVKISELYLAVTHDKQFLQEVEGFCKELLTHDPNSFDGHRLTGDLNYTRATQAYSTARKDEGEQLLQTAAAEYRKADSIKPGDRGVTMQLARTLAFQTHYEEAAQLYKSVMAKDK